jgi:hypothetical protein
MVTPMTDQITIIQFNYDTLDAETRIVVQQRTGEIKALMKRTAQDIIEIGEKLIDVKARLPHGEFGSWLEAEFEWTSETARRFMNVADKFKNNKLLNLEIAPSALYLLAAPSTPDEARQAAIDRAEAGERITHATAKEIVSEQYTPIWQLERAIRERFDRSSLRKEDVVKRLEEVKNKTSAGQVLLDSLMTDTNISGPRRKGDVRQACNNLIEQLKRELAPKIKHYHCKYWKCTSSERAFPVSSDTMTCEVCGAKHVIGFSGLILAPDEEKRLDQERQQSNGVSEVMWNEDGTVATVEVTNGDVAGGLSKLMDAESPETERFYNYKRDAKTSREQNIYVPQGYDACQTPAHALDPLVPYLETDSVIWEPAQGEGNLVEGLYDSGFSVIGSDILTDQNFFEWEPETPWDYLITNPPFSIKYKWLERCYELGKPFALLLPVETLGASTAIKLFKEHELELILIDKRVNFKMPNKGWNGGGAQFPVAWFTWQLNLGHQLIYEEATW